MSTFTIELSLERQTKNTWVYQADEDDDALIDTLYINKAAFKEAPFTIKVTVETQP